MFPLPAQVLEAGKNETEAFLFQDRFHSVSSYGCPTSPFLRTTPSKTVNFVSLPNVVLQSILLNSCDSVMRVHTISHSVVRGETIPDYSDVHFSSDFLEHIESRGQFTMGALVLQMSLAFDGYPTSSTIKCTPFVLFLRDLPCIVRNKKENVLLVASIQHKAPIRPAIYESIVNHITNILNYPLTIPTSHGGPISFFPRLSCLSLDLESVRSAFLMKGWRGDYGCPICLAKTTPGQEKKFLFQRSRG